MTSLLDEYLIYIYIYIYRHTSYQLVRTFTSMFHFNFSLLDFTKRGRTTNLVINTSVHIELISLITCEYIVLSKCVSCETDFPTHHVGMMSLLQHKIIPSIIENLKKYNKTILALHFIHGPKKRSSIISTNLYKYHR